MRRLTWLRIATSLVFLLAGSVGAHATIIHFRTTGVVTSAEVGNPFGLAANDMILLTGEYDDSFYDGTGAGEVSFGEGTGNSLSLFVGTVTLTETDDIGSSLFPFVTFMDGNFSGINFLTMGDDNAFGIVFSTVGTGFLGAGIEPRREITGFWNTQTVPEPSTLALFLIVAASVSLLRSASRVSP